MRAGPRWTGPVRVSALDRQKIGPPKVPEVIQGRGGESRERGIQGARGESRAPGANRAKKAFCHVLLL